MIGKAKAPALGADLAEHGGKGHQHPVFLFAKLLALHSPAGHQHGGVFVEKLCQFANFLRANAADRRRPFRRFCRSVALPGQIAGENVIAAGAAGQKRVILPAVFHQRMGDTEHQRHVGAHMRGDPLRRVAKEFRRFRSHGIDADHPLPALTQTIEPRDALLIGSVPGNF